MAKIEKQLSTVSDPLELTWRQGGYYVNKPEDRTGEYVSKEVAQGMLKALQGMCEYWEFMIDDPNFKEYVTAKAAIQKATQP